MPDALLDQPAPTRILQLSRAFCNFEPFVKLEPVGLDEGVSSDVEQASCQIYSKHLKACVSQTKHPKGSDEFQGPDGAWSLDEVLEYGKLKNSCLDLSAQLASEEERVQELEQKLEQAQGTIETLSQMLALERRISESLLIDCPANRYSPGHGLTQCSISPTLRLNASPTEFNVPRRRAVTLLVGRVSDIHLAILIIFCVVMFLAAVGVSSIWPLFYGELVTSSRYNTTFLIDKSRFSLYLYLFAALCFACGSFFGLCLLNKGLLCNVLKTFEVLVVALNLMIALCAFSFNYFIQMSEAGMELRFLDMLTIASFQTVFVIGVTLSLCTEAVHGVQMSSRSLQILISIGYSFALIGILATAVFYRFVKDVFLPAQFCYWYDCTTPRAIFTSSLTYICFFWLKVCHCLVLRGRPFVLTRPRYRLASC